MDGNEDARFPSGQEVSFQMIRNEPFIKIVYEFILLENHKDVDELSSCILHYQDCCQVMASARVSIDLDTWPSKLNASTI